jgi:hypothetical protein
MTVSSVSCPTPSTSIALSRTRMPSVSLRIGPYRSTISSITSKSRAISRASFVTNR